MPTWLDAADVLYLHSELLDEHGGAPGVRDEGALESTLARPRNLHAYAPERATSADYAASLGFGFARNHCFLDGNKRVALAAIDVFLQKNGFELTATEPDAYRMILGVAQGEISEQELAGWLRANMTPFDLDADEQD